MSINCFHSHRAKYNLKIAIDLIFFSFLLLRTPYLALARTFEKIESESSRLRMIEILANFFRSVILMSPSDLVACVYLSLNQLAPAYEGLELGIGEQLLMTVISQSTGRTLKQVKDDSKNTGDLGIVAEQSKSKQNTLIAPKPLTVDGVFVKLREIARMSGHSVSLIKTTISLIFIKLNYYFMHSFPSLNRCKKRKSIRFSRFLSLVVILKLVTLCVHFWVNFVLVWPNSRCYRLWPKHAHTHRPISMPKVIHTHRRLLMQSQAKRRLKRLH